MDIAMCKAFWVNELQFLRLFTLSIRIKTFTPIIPNMSCQVPRFISSCSIEKKKVTRGVWKNPQESKANDKAAKLAV